MTAASICFQCGHSVCVKVATTNFICLYVRETTKFCFKNSARPLFLPICSPSPGGSPSPAAVSADRLLAGSVNRSGQVRSAVLPEPLSREVSGVFRPTIDCGLVSAGCHRLRFERAGRYIGCGFVGAGFYGLRHCGCCCWVVLQVSTNNTSNTLIGML